MKAFYSVELRLQTPRSVLRTVVLTAIFMLVQFPGAHAADSWVAAWAVAPQAVSTRPDTPALNRAGTIDGQTVRQIVYPRLNASRMRLHISNRFGTQPLHIDAVTAALAGRGPRLLDGSVRAVTFDGKPSVTIAAHGERDSDALAFPVGKDRPVAVSFYVGERTQPTTWHKIASQVSYVSVRGNHVSDSGGDAFPVHRTNYIWLTGLTVDAPGARALVAIGDSITDGMRSTLNANRRWPDAFARRLPAAAPVAVLNLGISGNRLLSPSACYGESVVDRFDRDALAQPGVRAVVVLIGINDINFASMPPRQGLDCDAPHTQVDAQSLIDGYKRLIDSAHRRHVTIIGGTITPASLNGAAEQTRQRVNAWIRTSRAFDGVADFDAALRDPAHPSVLLRRYDSGDRIHPSDAGYQAMAAAVPLPASPS